MVFCTTCGSKLEEQWIICPNCGASPKKIIEPEQKAITPQQKIMTYRQTPDKREQTKKRRTGKILMIITIVVLSVLLTINMISSIHTGNKYYSLIDKYDDLQDDYNELLDEYNVLYDLFAQYQSILIIAGNPLTNPDTPTIDEVASWLESDNTDTFDYTENFMCGDFFAMLMGRAKLMNWRIRVACMFYSYEFESGWENPSDPYGSYGHAFNVILCQDYNGDYVDDWFYIEPQTDAIWYVVIDSVPFIHYEIWNTFTGGISGTVWSEPYYINHYSYFA